MSILNANGSVACAECGRKARDERDKLLDGFHAMQQLYEDELKHALAENAKLRELVAKYSAAAKYLCGHSHCNECNLDCASVFDDVPSGWDCARMLLDKRARELGIEVN